MYRDYWGIAAFLLRVRFDLILCLISVAWLDELFPSFVERFSAAEMLNKAKKDMYSRDVHLAR